MAPTFATAKYHSFRWDGTHEPTYSPQSSFDLSLWPIGDPNDPNSYAEVIMEPVAESYAEVPIAIAVFRNINGGQTVNFKWIRNRDNALLFEFSYDIPGGPWVYYWVAGWLGHFTYEIIEASPHRCEISSPYGNKTLNMNFTGEGKIKILEFKSDKLQANAGELITLSGQIDNEGSVSDNARMLISFDDGTPPVEYLTSALPPNVPWEPYVLPLPPTSTVMPERNFNIKLETFHET